MNAEDEVPILKTSNKVVVRPSEQQLVASQQHSWMMNVLFVHPGTDFHPEGAEESPEAAGRCEVLSSGPADVS